MSDIANTKGPKATAGLSDKELMGLIDKLIAQGAQELTLERLMWKPESCGQFPVIGHIVSINDMPEADRADNPDWRAFVVALTQDTYGIGRDKKVVKVKAGSEVIVPANWELSTNLARFALDPNEVHELGIVVKSRDDIGGGKKMWRFRVITVSSKKREGAHLLALGEGVGGKQLGEGAANGQAAQAAG